MTYYRKNLIVKIGISPVILLHFIFEISLPLCVGVIEVNIMWKRYVFYMKKECISYPQISIVVNAF